LTARIARVRRALIAGLGGGLALLEFVEAHDALAKRRALEMADDFRPSRLAATSCGRTTSRLYSMRISRGPRRPQEEVRVNEDPTPAPVRPQVAWMRQAQRAQNAPEATKVFAKVRDEAQN
jgi:hypothetical protein